MKHYCQPQVILYLYSFTVDRPQLANICNKEASKIAGHAVFEISCSLTLTYQISLATEKSPVWDEYLTSYKTFPTPKNWLTMSFKQKRNH